MTKKQKVWTTAFLALAAAVILLSAFIFTLEPGLELYFIFYNSLALVVIAFMAAFPTNEVVKPFIIRKIPTAIFLIGLLNFGLIFLHVLIPGFMIAFGLSVLCLIYLFVLMILVWKIG